MDIKLKRMLFVVALLAFLATACESEQHKFVLPNWDGTTAPAITRIGTDDRVQYRQCSGGWATTTVQAGGTNNVVFVADPPCGTPTAPTFIPSPTLATPSTISVSYSVEIDGVARYFDDHVSHLFTHVVDVEIWYTVDEAGVAHRHDELFSFDADLIPLYPESLTLPLAP